MTFQTQAGKVLQIKRDPKSAQFKVEFATGGELPESLSGTFSTNKMATIAILMYLDTVDSKKKSKQDKE